MTYAQVKYTGIKQILLNFSVSQAPTIVSYTKRASQAVAGEEAMMRGLGVSLVYVGGRTTAQI